MTERVGLKLQALLAGLALLLFGLLLLALPARAAPLALQPAGTFAAPIYVTAPPGDPRLFVVERGGTIRVVENGTTLGTAFLDISAMTTTDGERGLLSMAFDPNYAGNGLFYVFYTGGGGNPPGGALGDIFVDEYQVSGNPNVANPASRRNVLTIGHSASNHNGGQLQFGKDGLLYISVGDNANAANSQTTANLLGKLLRIDPHGATPGAHTIPADNPFGNAVWSLGLRNPWRFSFDHLDGSLLIGDVGGGIREEVDYLPSSTGLGRGVNLGWACREGFVAGPGACSGTFTDPIFDYENPPADCAAITGGFVYRGSDVPELAGRYLYADLCESELRSLVPALPLAADPRDEGIATDPFPVSFGEDSRCELYVAAGNTVSKIVSAPAAIPGSGGCAVASGVPAPFANPAAASPVAKKKCERKRTKKKRKRCRRKKKKKNKRR